MTVRPTKKQRELLDYIEDFIAGHGYSPSYREIMNGLQYNSVATVALHVGSLIKRGHLRKRDYSARSLEVVDSLSAEDAGSFPAMSESDHEAWLMRRIESRLQQSGTVADGHILIKALELLGLSSRAEELQTAIAASALQSGSEDHMPATEKAV